MMLRPGPLVAVLALCSLMVAGCAAESAGRASQPSETGSAGPVSHGASAVTRRPVSSTCLRSDGFLDLLDTTRQHLLETIDTLGPAEPPAGIGSVRAAVAGLRGEAATLLTLGREFADYPDCGDPAVRNLLDAMGAELVTLATHLDLIELDEEVESADFTRLDRVIDATARLVRLLERLDRALAGSDG